MTRTTLLALLSVAALGLAGCSGGSTEEGAPESRPARPSIVSGAEAQRLVNEENATLLDVRSPGEFQGGHPSAAINIPVQALADRTSELDHERPVVVYCLSGARSATAASMLSREGFTVYDMGRVADWPGN